MSYDLTRIDALLSGALDNAAGEERVRYLDSACGGDAELRARVEALLQIRQGPAGPAVQGERTASLDSMDSTFQSGEGPGTSIGPYKLLQLLGEGGMGQVWLAEQSEPVRRTVALKVIKEGMDSSRVLARFEAERQALALMDHPNIAKVLDAGTTPAGRPYFVMEVVKGVHMTRYCDEQRLSVRERLELFIPVCQAIQHAHQKGIVHRDIKPSNVLVARYDDRPVPKVIDFGIAKATGLQLTQRTLCTEFGALIGTPEYMSPEQAGSNPMDIDTRSDIYSLGVLLYELLTGTTPLTLKTGPQIAFDEVRRRIREEDPPKPSTRLTDTKDGLAAISAQRRLAPATLAQVVRGDLDWIVMKALDKDRNRRYETANALSMDLQRHLHDEAVLAGPPTARYKLKKFVRKHRTGVAVTAAFLFLLTAAAVVSTCLALWAGAQQRRARSSERHALAVLSFFQEKLLAAARPEGRGRGLGKDVSLRAAVDAAEQEIATSFTNRPLVEASIRHVLGQTYSYLGEQSNAIRQHERAVALREGYLGRGHDETLKSVLNLANDYRDAGRWGEAWPLYDRVFKLRNATLGPDHPETLLVGYNLGSAYELAGRLNDAMPLKEENLRRTKARFGPGDPDTLRAMSSLASTYHNAGRQAEALALYEEALKRAKDTLGIDHPDTADYVNNLGIAYRRAGRTNEAITLHEKALAEFKAKLGPNHPDTLSSMANLAVAYRTARRLDDALALSEETLQRRKARLGADHPQSLQSMQNLAVVFRDLGRQTDAVVLFESTLKLMKPKLGPAHPNTLRCMNTLADALTRLGRRTEALSLYEEAVKLRTNHFGLAHPDTRGSIYNLATAYRSAGRTNDAMALYEQLVAFLRTHSGTDHEDTQYAMVRLARAYSDFGRYPDAERLYSDLVRSKRKSLPADSKELAWYLDNLAKALLEQNKHAEAEPLLRESLKIREKQAPEDWETADARSRLGKALLGQKRFTEAEPLLLQGYDGLKSRATTIPTESRSSLKFAGERIVRLYEAWNKPDQAAEWRRKL